MPIRSKVAVGAGAVLKLIAIALVLWNMTREPPIQNPPPPGCDDSDYMTACDDLALRRWRADEAARARDFHLSGRKVMGAAFLTFLMGGPLFIYGIRPA